VHWRKNLAVPPGADLLLRLEDGRTVKVKVGGMGYRKLVLFGARMQ